MARSCPCCGQPMRRPPPTVLHERLRAPAKRLLIRLLARELPYSVARDDILDLMYAGTNLPGDPAKTLRETVRLARMDIEPFGWTIVNDAPVRSARALYRLAELSD